MRPVVQPTMSLDSGLCQEDHLRAPSEHQNAAVTLAQAIRFGRPDCFRTSPLRQRSCAPAFAKYVFYFLVLFGCFFAISMMFASSQLGHVTHYPNLSDSKEGSPWLPHRVLEPCLRHLRCISLCNLRFRAWHCSSDHKCHGNL